MIEQLSEMLGNGTNLKKYKVKRAMIEQMRENLRANLDKASNEDWRFILECLGTKIMAFGDGTWDIEINIPVMKTSKTVDLITDKTSCDFASKLRPLKTCEGKGVNSIFSLLGLPFGLTQIVKGKIELTPFAL